MSFNDDDGDFADFQNCTLQQDKTETNFLNDQDDFADFQNADLIVNKNKNEHQTDLISKLSINETKKFETILKDAFPNIDLTDINRDNQSIIIKDLFIDETKKCLWKQIQNLEESPSLQLRWNKTQSFQNFLSALKINLKQTLNNPHVPIFASSLGLLEPVKLKPNQENEEHLSNSIVNFKETNSTDCLSTNDNKNDDKSSQSESISLNSLNTNPSLLDLDNLNDKTDQPINGLIVKSNSTYDKLIKNVKQPDKQKKNDEATSDTNKILDELPILNFMRSNTLMFNQ